MTVITLATRHTAPPVHRVHTPAHTTTTPARSAHTPAIELHLVQLHAQACTALREALRQLQSPADNGTHASTWATATSRAHRGLTALKRGSALVNQLGAAPVERGAL